MRTRIKICGITSEHDAELAIEAGADYLGLIFVPNSPRYVAIEKAQAIAQAVNQRIPVVGVFQNAPLETIQSTLQRVELDLIQLHGAESMADCKALPRPVIKMMPVSQNLPTLIRAYGENDGYQYIQHFLFEPPKGLPWDWSKASFDFLNALKHCPSYFLAGGLTSENVQAVIHQFRPYGVDIASGAESGPGVKDPIKLNRFCQAVQAINQQEGVL